VFKDITLKFWWLFLGCMFTVSVLAKPEIVKINGYDVEYEIVGKGKHTVLLEAGGAAGLSDWDAIFQKLTKQAKIIRYSRIGNGGSEKIKKHYSSEEYAQEANLVLDALNIKESVVYIAHSYGAYVARRFASM
jgi:pimeloyl-ACP methyl ester carboxylesterase